MRDITATAGIETEVFIHGALCYSYSGLCLFSAQTLGRSGNRGKCAYSCRDSFEVTGAPMTPARRHPGAARSDQRLPVLDEGPGPARSPAGPAGRRRVLLQDRGPQEKPALRRHHHRLLPQAARRHPGADGTARIAKPTCTPSSAGRGRGCSCNRTRTRKWPIATPSAIAARSIGKIEAIVGSGGGGRQPASASAPAGPWNSTTACRSTCRRWASRSVSPSISCGSCRRGRQEVFKAPAGIRRRGAVAATIIRSFADRCAGLLFVVAGGQAELSPRPAQAGPAPGAQAA